MQRKIYKIKKVIQSCYYIRFYNYLNKYFYLRLKIYYLLKK